MQIAKNNVLEIIGDTLTLKLGEENSLLLELRGSLGARCQRCPGKENKKVLILRNI